MKQTSYALTSCLLSSSALYKQHVELLLTGSCPASGQEVANSLSFKIHARADSLCRPIVPTHICIIRVIPSLVLPYYVLRVSTSSSHNISNNPSPVLPILNSARSAVCQSPSPEQVITMAKAPLVYAASASAGSMHVGVVSAGQTDDTRVHTSTPAISSATPTNINDVSETTRRDVHTASSINTAQSRFPKPAVKEPNLAHQAALRRVKGKDVAPALTNKAQPTANSKPVLVRKSSAKTDMRMKQKPTIDTASRSPKLPPLESFSFQDILASIGPDAEESIEAIAEICGRSKMSLAEEHSSHRPPHGDLQNFQNSPADSVLPMKLETVEETRPKGPHTRSKSRALALALASAYHGNDAVTGDATAAASNVTISGRNRTPTSSCPGPASLLPQILTWLRCSNEAPSSAGRDDAAVTRVRALHNSLSDAASIQS